MVMLILVVGLLLLYMGLTNHTAAFFNALVGA